MASLAQWMTQKVHRLAEAADLIARYSADAQTQRQFLHIYASLGDRARYNDEVALNLRVNGHAFRFVMRLSDIFVVGEMLHERQYDMHTKLSGAPTIVDLGANVGASAVWFLSRHPGARLYAFEPAGENFDFLTRNVGSFDNVTLSRAAVGAQSGQAMLQHGEFAGMHSLLIEGNGKSEAVELTTLADYMTAHAINHIDLLKLDIEGGELDALKGLGPRIADVGAIVGEVHETIVDQDEFYRFLASNGFKVLWKKNFFESRELGVHGFEAVRTA